MVSSRPCLPGSPLVAPWTFWTPAGAMRISCKVWLAPLPMSDFVGHQSLASAQTVPAAPRIHDRQRGQLGDAQEILIGGDEELGPTRQRRGEHPGVIRVAQREIGAGGWSSDDSVGAALVLDEGDLGWRHLESLAQDPA